MVLGEEYFVSDLAIRVENQGKRYPSAPLRTRRIGALQKRHDTLRDVIAAAFQRSKVPAFQGSDDHLIWALRDDSFEVKRGEGAGVIGRNGTGFHGWGSERRSSG